MATASKAAKISTKLVSETISDPELKLMEHATRFGAEINNINEQMK